MVNYKRKRKAGRITGGKTRRRKRKAGRITGGKTRRAGKRIIRTPLGTLDGFKFKPTGIAPMRPPKPVSTFPRKPKFLGGFVVKGSMVRKLHHPQAHTVFYHNIPNIGRHHHKVRHMKTPFIMT